MIGHLTPFGPAGTADWVSRAGDSAPQAGPAMAAALRGAASGVHFTLASGRTLTPVMTFASRDGSLCRQFDVAAAQDRQRGLACRTPHQAWRLVILTTTASATSSGDYRVASGPGDDPVSAMADRLIRGEPMDAAAETAALRSR